MASMQQTAPGPHYIFYTYFKCILIYEPELFNL